MSTVLKAVQELERRGAPVTAAELHAAEGRRPATWALATGGLLVVLTAAVVMQRTFRDGVATPAAPVAAAEGVVVAARAATPERAPQASAEPARAGGTVTSGPSGVPSAETAVRPAAAAALPWGRIEEPDVDRRYDPAPAPESVRAPEQQRVAARSASPALETRAGMGRVDAPSRSKDAPSRSTGVPSRQARSGIPPIDVLAIVFRDEVAGRKAVLRIDGGAAVTLRQGESRDGVDVQVITENAVYLRRNGEIFSVGIGR